MLDLSHQSMDVDCCMACITEAGLYQTMMVCWLIWVVSTCRTVTELLQRFGYKKDAKFPHKYGGYFRNDADHRDFVGIGTAAGQSCLLVLLLPNTVVFCGDLSSPLSCCTASRLYAVNLIHSFMCHVEAASHIAAVC